MQVADSGAFFANPGTDGFSSAGYAIDAIGDMNPLNHGAFYYMPAVVLKTSLPGDANLDGRVDINDLTIVLANYGQTGMEWAQGEFTGERHGGHQRPDDRVGQLRPDGRLAAWPSTRPCPSPRPCCWPRPHWPAAWRTPDGDN